MADTRGIEDDARAFLDAARRATLGTIAPDGRPRLVPVCFVVVGSHVFIAIDDKPKRSADPLDLARVRDILERPAVTLLVDTWDEDWARLGWVRLDGSADLVEPSGPGHAEAVAALRSKYPQYGPTPSTTARDPDRDRARRRLGRPRGGLSRRLLNRAVGVVRRAGMASWSRDESWLRHLLDPARDRPGGRSAA